jgi:hypothetical protein
VEVGLRAEEEVPAEVGLRVEVGVLAVPLEEP